MNKLKPFKQINRDYIFNSAELRKKLGIEGQIMTMGLMKGRSPNEVEQGKSPEKDTWYITTEELIKL